MSKIAEENKLKPKIQEVFTLEKQNIKISFEKLRSRRTIGKICFEIYYNKTYKMRLWNKSTYSSFLSRR